MKRKQRYRSIFKLGTRGRRGRVAVEDRWERVGKNEALEDNFAVRHTILRPEHESEPAIASFETDPPHEPEQTASQSRLVRGEGNELGEQDILHMSNMKNNSGGLHDSSSVLSNVMMQVIDDIADADVHVTSDERTTGLDTALLPHVFEEENNHGNAHSTDIGDLMENHDDDDASEHSSPQLVSLDENYVNPLSANHSDHMNGEDNRPVENELPPQRIKEILKGWKKIANWTNLLAVCFVSGSIRLSVDQYETVRVCINSLIEQIPSQTTKMPSYTTVTRSILPFLKRWSFPKCDTHSAVVDRTKSGVRAQGDTDNNDAFGKYAVVNPSEWTRMDMRCRATWEMTKVAFQERDKNSLRTRFSCIEDVPILKNRSKVLEVLRQFVPQGFNEDGSGCALLRALRCPQVHLTLHFPESPCFPSEVISSLQPISNHDGSLTSAVVVPKFNRLVGDEESLTEGVEQSRTDTAALFAFLKKPMVGLWREGDVCTLLDSGTIKAFVLVLIHHQPLPGAVTTRIEMLCIPISSYIDGDGDSSQVVLHDKDAVKAVVKGITTTASTPWNRVDSRCTGNALARSSGKLSNGMPYFIDRILLYSDGFSQYGSKKGSAGGVYCMSLNQLPSQRQSRRRVRVLELTPPGISTAQGIRSVLPDLVESCTKGFKTTNADGNEVMVFTDVVGFVCDYHEVSSVIDVVGCTGRAPCHLCSFSRFNGHHSIASSYGHSTNIHSVHPCFARSADRTEVLRHSDLTDESLVRLGLNGRHHAQKKDGPLIEFYKELKKAYEASDVMQTEENMPVVTPFFDPYRSIMVAPDHLLAGIAINEMNLCFKMMLIFCGGSRLTL